MDRWEVSGEIDEADIPTAPVGLYEVRGRRMVRDCYAPERDTFLHDVPCRLLVRIDHGTELPKGVEYAALEGGRRVIQAWVPLDPQA